MIKYQQQSRKTLRLNLKYRIFEPIFTSDDFFILDVCSYTMGSLISFFRRPELDTNSQLESIDSNLKRLFEKRAAHIRSKADLYTKTRNYG